MARFALLSLGLALALACIAPVASSESPAPDSVGLLERRRSEQGGRQPRHEARSQHGTASTSYASDTSTYQSAQYYTPVNDQKSASGVAYASSSKTSEPAAAAVSTTTGWTSAAGSSSSAGAGGGAATLSSYASSSTSAMSPAPSSTAAAASPQSVDIVVLQLAVVLEVRPSLARPRSRPPPADLLLHFYPAGIRRVVLPRRSQKVRLGGNDERRSLARSGPHHVSLPAPILLLQLRVY